MYFIIQRGNYFSTINLFWIYWCPGAKEFCSNYHSLPCSPQCWGASTFFHRLLASGSRPLKYPALGSHLDLFYRLRLPLNRFNASGFLQILFTGSVSLKEARLLALKKVGAIPCGCNTNRTESLNYYS